MDDGSGEKVLDSPDRQQVNGTKAIEQISGIDIDIDEPRKSMSAPKAEGKSRKLRNLSREQHDIL